MTGIDGLLDVALPDEAHEALRRGFHQAIADLGAQSVSMDDFRLALQALNGVVSGLNTLATSYLAAVQASQSDRQQLNTRVAALEAKPAVRTVAVAPPVALGLLSIGTRDMTLTWDRIMPDTNYEVDLWPSTGLGAATFTVKSKTTTQVVVTVKNTALIAAGGSLAAVAWRNA